MTSLQQLSKVFLVSSVTLAVGLGVYEVSWLGKSSLAPVFMAICGAIVLLAAAVGAREFK